MFAVLALAVAVSVATTAPIVDAAVDAGPGDDDAASADDGAFYRPVVPPRPVVGGSVGATFITEPAFAGHLGVWVRGNGRGPFQFRGDVAVDVTAALGGVLSADVAALFVHALDDRVELTIGGGPAGGAVAHAGRVDGFFGIVGIATAGVDIVPGFVLGLELRGLAGVMVPTAAPLLAPSVSLTTGWRL